MTERPAVLVFDLGGVLVENPGLEQLRRLCGNTLAEPEVRARWLSSVSVRAFERGQISPREFAERFVGEWRLPLAAAAFLAEFEQWLKGPIPGAEALLRGLRSRYRIAALTNSNELHWARLRELSSLFDHVFLSHELGLIKPDREIFECVIQRLDVAPGRIVFFDDSPENVEAATGAGMRAHRVAGVRQLEEALSRLGAHP